MAFLCRRLRHCIKWLRYVAARSQILSGGPMKIPKIVHVLADGTRTDTIKGKVVPGDNPVYEIILQGNTSREKKLA